jgi:DNA-binding response OmpR family regulator
VDVCVQRIRKKLISDKNPKFVFPIESIRGVGYRINLESVA